VRDLAAEKVINWISRVKGRQATEIQKRRKLHEIAKKEANQGRDYIDAL